MNLYHPLILKYNDEPFHFRKFPEADKIIEAYNPVCGDQFKLFLNLDNGIIKEAYFHGYGCAVSKAASSVLVKRIIGKNMADCQALYQEYLRYLDPKVDLAELTDEELLPFAAAREFPGRKKCASLSWDALSEELT